MAIRIKGEEEKIKKKERVSINPGPNQPETKNESRTDDSVKGEPNSTSQKEKEETKPSIQRQGAQIGNEITVVEQTKQKIQLASKEANEEAPRLTTAVNTYQEQNIQMGSEAAESYFKLQEQWINSIQTTWNLYAEQSTKLFWNTFLAPQRMFELYANSIASFADAWIVANKNVNYFFSENLEKVININLERARQISNDLAGACMNFAKMETKKMDVVDTKSQVTEGQVEEVTTMKTKKD